MTTVPSTDAQSANADTDRIYAKQKRYIWPVACVAALAVGFIAGSQQPSANTTCLQAVIAADQGFNLAVDAFGIVGNSDKAGAQALRDDITPVMDKYWSLSDDCQGGAR
jgi:hypothetical protein